MTTEAMVEPKIQLIEGEIGVVNLGPHDRLVLMFPDRITPEKFQYIGALMKEHFSGIPCLILDNGGRVGVIHETTEET